MFDIGDYVVFGTDGVCTVEAVGSLDMEGVSKEKLYYTLAPVGKSGSNRIFAPVDGKRVVMRKVLSLNEAREFVAGLDHIGRLEIPDERKREETYKAVLQSCDHIRIMQLIREMYERRRERVALGKKLASVDERYFNAAENSLYSELSLSLDCERDEVRGMIDRCFGDA